jgi:hypothetical protein
MGNHVIFVFPCDFVPFYYLGNVVMNKFLEGLLINFLLVNI